MANTITNNKVISSVPSLVQKFTVNCLAADTGTTVSQALELDAEPDEVLVVNTSLSDNTYQLAVSFDTVNWEVDCKPVIEDVGAGTATFDVCLKWYKQAV
jgi:hypothetical protein